MPTDQATREYLCYLNEKIRQQTIGHKYAGTLSTDARRLGILPDRVNEILNARGGITSMARELFKTMVPEHDREVDHWNKLPEDVLLKEKVLIGTRSSALPLRHVTPFVSMLSFRLLGSLLRASASGTEEDPCQPCRMPSKSSWDTEEAEATSGRFCP